jgi:hypothetical protein
MKTITCEKGEWCADGFVGDFVAAGSFKEPLSSTTCFRNLLILREEFWVEYLVPNPISQQLEIYGILLILSNCC